MVPRAKRYVNENFTKGISLDDVSRLVDINPYYFNKLSRQGVGENFIEYLTRTRIGHVKQPLGDPRCSVEEVCAMCGYNDPDYFSRIFRKYEGKTSSEHREG